MEERKNMAQWNSHDVGAVLRSKREALQLSIRQVANAAGVDAGTVNRIEHGKIRNPNTATLLAVAAALGISPAALFAAGHPDTPATSLPALRPYLRTRYPELSSQAAAQLTEFFEFLQERYGAQSDPGGADER